MSERSIGEWAGESLAELGIEPDDVEAQDEWLAGAEWQGLVEWASNEFPGTCVEQTEVQIPWPAKAWLRESSVPTSGLVVTRAEYRLGVHGDLGATAEAEAYFDSASDVIDAIDHLTRDQPEGTDWLAWACQRTSDEWTGAE